MDIVYVGRRAVEKQVFIDAVRDSDNITHICEYIGFNPVPQSTRKNIEKTIDDLQLSTEHFKKRYAFSEDGLKSLKKKGKVLNVSENNKKYLDEFLETIAANSRTNYKCLVGNFMEKIGTQDFCKTNEKQIAEYANEKASAATCQNARSCIRSCLIFCVANNINRAKEKVSKEMLIWLIGSRAAKMCRQEQMTMFDEAG